MRYLRPGRLIELSSGLWAIDGSQPVAAVLDPVTGAVCHTVSWTELPPAPPGEEQWPPPRVVGDGSSLWVQQERTGPLARVDVDGIAVTTWTNGLHLAACGPGVAWCTSPRPDQELVEGAGGRPVRQLLPDRLLRVTADGGCTIVEVEHPVRHVQAEADALFVEVDVEPWQLRSLGADSYEVIWASRWLRLPWDANLPEVVSVDTHCVARGSAPKPRYADGGHLGTPWHEPDEATPLHTPGHRWHVGWSQTPSARGPQWRQVVASARPRPGGAARQTWLGTRVPRQWSLGDGTALAAAPLGDRLVVAVAREPAMIISSKSPVDILVIDPSPTDARILLAGDTIDITDRCRPLVPHPVDADSYTQRVLTANSSIDDYWRSDDGSRSPLAEGLSDAHTALHGEWPDTCLEWTFALDRYPGLTLRRRVPLFDELGRIDEPEFAIIHLMEDIDTGALPPASDARDGILDI